jgi:sucrose phosphorylase
MDSTDATPARQRMLDRLRLVYGNAAALGIFASVEQLLLRYAGRIPARAGGWSQRDAFLITYGDSIVEDGAPPLRTLHQFLKRDVGDLLSFVHLLPFYPFTSDDGFSVVDFRMVREDLGAWDDIARLADDYRVVFDGVINHVSASSGYMKGYSAGDPNFADFFVALDPKTDTSSVLRTRNLPLLHDYPMHDGSTRWLWTTFSRDQLDLNYHNPRVLLEILDVLLGYAGCGASMIRLDAIPYMWKQLGTRCAHLPQTHALIKLIRDVFDEAAPHVILLTETNVPHEENIAYFGDRGDEAQVIYNFTLAPLILWSIHKSNATVLTDWARGLELIGPRATYLNITATHDGVGVRPTEGILSHDERMELVQLAKDHGGDVTGKRNSDGSISPYELNLNYFDAVNDPRRDGNDPLELQIRRFMLSQAIPICLMGMPGIYIHSLLGSRNDYAGVQRTGRARSINREQLRLPALREELSRPDSIRARVFAEYRRLLTIRAAQPAFDPNASQEILDLGPAIFAVRRNDPKTGQTITALHNFTGRETSVHLRGGGLDLLSSDRVESDAIVLRPYQVRWLTD